eukprot:233415_1
MVSNILLHSTVAFGASISFISTCLLLYSLIRRFKTHTIHQEMRTATIVVLSTYLIWDIVLILTQSLIPPHLCALRLSLTYSSYVLTRASFYYFLILRAELSFAGTPLSFPPHFIKRIKRIICFVFVISAAYFIFNGLFQTFSDGKCHPMYQIQYIQIAVTCIYMPTDICLGIFCISIYLHRLKRLHRALDQPKLEEATSRSENADDVSRKDDTIKRDIQQQLEFVMKKQTKLAFISFVTTIAFTYSALVSPYLFLLMYLDGIVNALCIYCTFEVNHKYYESLCNCNGNTCLQCVFCWCCYCCHASEPKGDSKTLQVLRKRKEARCDGDLQSTLTSNETSNQMTNDEDLSQIIVH